MKWIALFIFLSGIQGALAQEAAVQFDHANQLYRNGDYQKAAAMYEQIVKNGYESYALYYNLGNTYFKLKNIPAAILQYERARRLAPHDEDVLYNLRLANLRVIDKIEPLPQLFFIEWWRSIINLFSSSGWAMIAILSLWCATIAGAVVLVNRAGFLQRIMFVSTLIALCICVLAFVGTFQRLHRERDEQTAIVFAPSVSVKSAPDVQSTDLFVLHEGVKVEFLDEVGEWRKIRLADGKVGWLSVSSIEVI
ncbi:MAG: tetratricopeptide repeat protein [Ignavibacteria bacterium]|nr:tetratricopeptide repeat protein [Ignavibacteria bacterium]MBI3766558.1 tetratricopeptide repeat protein [Ignavibacteriales bacterium]